jgi:hydroxyacylglutathione hydrolase
MIDVRMFTVGPVQENCYIVREPGAERAVIIDPGDEPERLLEALSALGITKLEAILLANIMDYVPFAGFGPFESYEADHTVTGGETLSLAGLEFEVTFTPGHSPGHVSYAVAADNALFSGDVLFQGSVGRVDLPGGDWPTLLASIDSLIKAYPAEMTVYAGHMGITTLGDERATNPFLRELAHQN